MKFALKSTKIIANVYLAVQKNKGLEGLKMRSMYTVFLIPHPAERSVYGK